MRDAVAVPEVRLIASMGLHEDDEKLRVGPDRWPAVLQGLTFQRLTGIAFAAWESGLVDLEPDQGDELLDRHRSAMTIALAIEQRLLRLRVPFEAAGVRAVVLKGCAVAHTTYPEPSMRPYGDLDLLVSTTDWRSACSVLRANGYRRDLPEPRPGFDERFGKAATHSDADGYQVDLHRTLVLGPFGLWLDPEQLLGNTERFVLGGREIERLDATGLLLNAALHAGLGASPPLLLPLRDVAQAVGDPRVDWDRLERWVKAWHLAPAMRLAFESSERQLGAELPAPARQMASAPLGRTERKLMSAYEQRRRVGGLAFSATRAIPGVRAKVAYLFGLALPSREFLQARSGTAATYRSRWRIPIRWIAKRRRRASRSAPMDGGRVG